MKGKHLSDEQKKHLSEINTGKKLSEKTKSKLSKTTKEYWKSLSEIDYKKMCTKISNSRKGCKISENQKEQIRKKLTGTKQSEETKKKKSETIKRHLYLEKVFCETDNKIFSSCKECSLFYNISCYKILSAIKNKTLIQGKKFRWL